MIVYYFDFYTPSLVSLLNCHSRYKLFVGYNSIHCSTGSVLYTNTVFASITYHIADGTLLGECLWTNFALSLFAIPMNAPTRVNPHKSSNSMVTKSATAMNTQQFLANLMPATFVVSLVDDNHRGHGKMQEAGRIRSGKSAVASTRWVSEAKTACPPSPPLRRASVQKGAESPDSSSTNVKAKTDRISRPNSPPRLPKRYCEERCLCDVECPPLLSKEVA